jgi:hypothetical protein
MWIRRCALAGAALVPLFAAGAATAQSMNTQAMLQHQRAMNQIEMMNRSQSLQRMWQAHQDQAQHRKSIKATKAKKGGTAAASSKPKAVAKPVPKPQ